MCFGCVSLVWVGSAAGFRVLVVFSIARVSGLYRCCGADYCFWFLGLVCLMVVSGFVVGCG